MVEFPTRLRNSLRWSDGVSSFLFNPQSGALLSTTPLFNDLLTVCHQMDREQIVAHLSAKHPAEDVCLLLTSLDQSNAQLLLFETSTTPGLLHYSEEMIEKGLVDTLSLNLTHDCNLRCGYCFGTLEYMKDASSMSEATAHAAIDYLFSEATEKQKCQVIYTGGEPLLNWSVLESTTRYAVAKAKQCSKEVTFVLKTNGTFITEQRLDFLEQHDFMIQLSIDGNQIDHDKARRGRDGTGSFASALAACEQMVRRQRAHRLQIRATVTHLNVKHFKENLLFLAGLEAGKILAGPVMVSEQSPYRLTRDDLALYRQALLDVVVMLTTNPHSPQNCKLLKALGYDSLHTDRPGSESRYGCGAGLWHLTVDVDGAILPCYRLAGYGKYNMGTIWTVNQMGIRQIQKQIVPIYNRDHNTRCRRCWGQVICRRGCVAPELLETENEGAQCDGAVHVLKALLQAAVKNPTIRDSLPCL